jgi:hypothetical protein
MTDANLVDTEHCLEDWPPMLRAIAVSIGVEGALLLVSSLGGLEYYIPRNATEQHPLSQLLGYERFRALMTSHGGIRIAIPRDPYAHLAKGRVIAMLEARVDPRTIARECQVTQRYVRRVAALVGLSVPAPIDPRQMRFDF